MAKENDIGITTKKEENFTEWFQQLFTKAELADYTNVSGCMVFRPRSYMIWENIVKECDKRFKKIGIQNAYFPLFIPESSFAKEAEHLEGFAPEVAWVTHGGNTKLTEKLGVRPTSEAIMYESYSKWIRSHRDLPLRLNQWNNVIRWEFNNPVAFFRTREFLWNEGHTAFATEKEALEERDQILKIYDEVCSEYMALPGITGRKTEKEKFAGAIFSEKIHYYLPNGRVIEGPAYHYDGQNFAKSYDIKFKNKEDKTEYVYQNTFAISTRMLGAMFAIHSDDNGLIVPPKIAVNKLVIIPIFNKDTKDLVLKETKKLAKKLEEFNPIVDDREEVRPGWKYNEWELKGIPLRIEIGPRDIENKQVTIAKRNDRKKSQVNPSSIVKEVNKLLDEIQKELYDKADALFKENMAKADSLEEMTKLVKDKKVVKVPMCKKTSCEESVKDETAGGKVLYIDPKNTKVKNEKCISCNEKADYFVYMGKTY